MPWRKLLYWAGLALGLALFGRQLWQAAAALAVDAPRWAAGQWSAAAAALLLCVLAYVVQMAAWALIMAALGAPLGPVDTARAYLLPFTARYIPGTIWGYLGRSEWLARHHAVGYALSGAGSALEAGLYVISALAIAGVYYGGGALGWGVAAAFAAVAAALWLLPALAQRLRPGLGARPPHAATLAAVAGLYCLFWLLHGAVIALLAHSLGEAPPFGSATAAFSLAWAAGFLVIFVPSGLGVREGALASLLVGAGLPPTLANTVAVAGRLAIVAAELALVACGAALELRHWRAASSQEIQP